MADGEQTPRPTPRLRPAAPYFAGPLASSGAAPDPEPAAVEPPGDPAASDQAASDPADSVPADSVPADPVAAAAHDDATEHSAPDGGAAAGPAAATAAPADSAADVSAVDGAAAAGTAEPQPDAPTPAQPGPDTRGGPTATDPNPTPGTPTPGTPAPGPPTPGPSPAGEPAGSVPAWRRLIKPDNLRHLPAASRQAIRVTGAWARRPLGQLVLPAALLVTLVALAGTAGAFLVPSRTADRPVAGTPTATGQLPVQPALPGAAPTGVPGVPPPTATGLPPTLDTTPPVASPAVLGRPADALAGWAEQVATRVGVPAVAMQAYGYAELVAAGTTPGCRLSWTTLAAIGRVESNHGSANNAVLGADGQASPPIVGLPLDGQGGRQLIRDTDQGALDGDTTYDRAVGPMQFIPSTWRLHGVDADNDGVKDPNDIDDAALAAANYLCAGGKDLSTADDWWRAILSYNDVMRYAQDVFNAANDYGVRSRT